MLNLLVYRLGLVVFGLIGPIAATLEALDAQRALVVAARARIGMPLDREEYLGVAVEHDDYITIPEQTRWKL